MKWRAHDANDDELVYSVYYRGTTKPSGRCCAMMSTDRYVNLESDLFPDGTYTIRVVASDEPSAFAGRCPDGRKNQRAVLRWITRRRKSSSRTRGSRATSCVWRFRATDSFSPISRAEYSIDADDWQTAEPVGQISDYKIENYDLTVPMPVPTDAKDVPLTEHTIVVRVFDRYDNVGVAKTVIKTAAPGTTH